MINNLYKKSGDLLKFYSPGFHSLLVRYRVLIRYIISGGIAATVDLVILYLLTDIFHFWYLFSAALAFLVAFVVSFSLQKFWTFEDGSKEGIYKQVFLYLSVSLFGNLILNTILMYVFVDVIKIHYFISQIIVSAIIACLSFFIYRNFIFKKN